MSNKKALISFCILMALGTICLSLEVEIVSENTMRKIFDESIFLFNSQINLWLFTYVNKETPKLMRPFLTTVGKIHVDTWT